MTCPPDGIVLDPFVGTGTTSTLLHNLEENPLELIWRKNTLNLQNQDVYKRQVKGMLPKNTLGRAALLRLRLFEGAEHNHQAQKPAMIED